MPDAPASHRPCSTDEPVGAKGVHYLVRGGFVVFFTGVGRIVMSRMLVVVLEDAVVDDVGWVSRGVRRVRVSVVGLVVVAATADVEVAVGEVRRERDAAVCVSRATVAESASDVVVVVLSVDGALVDSSAETAGLGRGPAWTSDDAGPGAIRPNPDAAARPPNHTIAMAVRGRHHAPSEAVARARLTSVSRRTSQA